MSNIKSLMISGRLPYNTYSHFALTAELGLLNAPSWGFRLVYLDWSSYERPSAHGGGFIRYREFTIKGEEAVHPDYVTRLLQAIVDADGVVDYVVFRDEENHVELPVKIPEKTQYPQFVIEVVVQIQDAGPDAFADEDFDTMQLKQWLDDALILDLDNEGCGRVCDCVPNVSEDATVSLATAGFHRR